MRARHFLAGLWYGLLLKHRIVVNPAPGKRLLIGLGIGFLVSSLFVLVIGMLLKAISEGGTDSLQPFFMPGGRAAMRWAGEFLLTFALPGALAAGVRGGCVSDRLYARLLGRKRSPHAASESGNPRHSC
ncbi:MAG: hypothetical protein HQM01_06710 [Magnetococcales bacterium]|nr:hypothetical protein [Magnetococcales bacterium]